MQEKMSFGTAGRVNWMILAIGGVVLISLVAIAFAWYFPGREARRNAERLRDVQAITGALQQYAALHAGAYPTGLDAEEKQIGSATTACGVQTAQCSIPETRGCLDLTVALDPFLEAIPVDPGMGSDARTRYAVRSERGGGLLVIPCDYSE